MEDNAIIINLVFLYDLIEDKEDRLKDKASLLLKELKKIVVEALNRGVKNIAITDKSQYYKLVDFIVSDYEANYGRTSYAKRYWTFRARNTCGLSI